MMDTSVMILMNVKMVTVEDVLTTVPTHVEATSVLVNLAMSSRERRKGLGVAVGVVEEFRPTQA